MHMRKQLKVIGIVSLLGFANIAGAAQTNGYYAGLGFGQATSDADTAGILFISGPSALTVDDTDTAFNIFGGFKFNDYFAMELAYVDLGEVSVTANGAGFSDTYKFALDGLVVEAVGTWPINKHFSLIGKFGFIAWNSDATVNLSGIGSFSVNEDSTDLAFGVGGQFNFSKNFGLRAEFDSFDIDVTEAGAGDTNKFSLSAVVSF